MSTTRAARPTLVALAMGRPYHLADHLFGRLAGGFLLLSFGALVLPGLDPEVAVLFGRLDAASGLPVPVILAMLGVCAAGVSLAAGAVADVEDAEREAAVRLPRLPRPRPAPANLDGVPVWAEEFVVAQRP